MTMIQDPPAVEPFDLSVPRPDDSPLNPIVSSGDVLFVLGANGTGKSSLMHKFNASNSGRTRRISAHRQTWFSSNAITLSPQDKRSTESQIQSIDSQPQSRWSDSYSAQRASIAIYDLIDAENVRARSITREVDNKNVDEALNLSRVPAPIAVINELLTLSNIPIEISVRENEEVMANKKGGALYSVAELSDGERNALLIAAEVLTVKPGTLILIDEPERHLHRSIISPLLTHLFAKRTDCAFVVSTHDVMLPLDNPSARSLLVRSCAYSGSAVNVWEADLIPPETELDSELKKDILGARRKILFIEGTEQSLDKPLYSLIFPNISIVAKSGCRDVENAVSGIRAAADLNWLDAFGIVDNDRRTAEDIRRLKARGIYAISVYSVESIYYHPEIQSRVATLITSEDVHGRVTTAKRAALAALRPDAERLSARAVEKTLREQVMQHVPTQPQIAEALPIKIDINVAAIVAEESARFQAAIESENLSELIEKYPIRETPAMHRIATSLGFGKHEQYESAVRKLLMENQEALNFVRSLFGSLEADLQTS